MFNLSNNKLLLHVCCAPCGASIIPELKKSNIDFSVFFYNPNIFPKKEYEKRKETLIKYCKKLNVPLIISEGEDLVSQWGKDILGFENEPEMGKRCEKCIFHRLNKVGLYALENNFNIFATTLSVSKYKNKELIKNCGEKISKKYKNIDFWNADWESDKRLPIDKKISKEEGFYLQKYCGCFYSIKNGEEIC
jgi:hypothetical protein